MTCIVIKDVFTLIAVCVQFFIIYIYIYIFFNLQVYLIVFVYVCVQLDVLVDNIGRSIMWMKLYEVRRTTFLCSVTRSCFNLVYRIIIVVVQSLVICCMVTLYHTMHPCLYYSMK